MEIGPIRNQNLIFWPLAVKIDEGQQKIKIISTIKFTGFLPIPLPPSSGTTQHLRMNMFSLQKKEE